MPEPFAYIIAGGIAPLLIAILAFWQARSLRKTEDSRWERQAHRDEAKAIAEHTRASDLRREEL